MNITNKHGEMETILFSLTIREKNYCSLLSTPKLSWGGGSQQPLKLSEMQSRLQYQTLVSFSPWSDIFILEAS